MSESLAAIILCSITVPTLGYVFISTKSEMKETMKEIKTRIKEIEINPQNIAIAIEQMRGIEQQTEEIENRVIATETRVNEVVQNYLLRFDELKNMLISITRSNDAAHGDIKDAIHIIKEQMYNKN